MIMFYDMSVFCYSPRRVLEKLTMKEKSTDDIKRQSDTAHDEN